MSMVRSAILKGLHSTGAVRLWQRVHRRQVAILMFHGVTDDAGGAWTPLRPRLGLADLERYVVTLKKHCRIVTLPHAARMLGGQATFEPDCVALTFDDGYADNATLAWPMLRRHGCEATFFLPTAYIDSGKAFWYDRIDFALGHLKPGVKSLEAAGRCWPVPSRSHEGLSTLCSAIKTRCLAQGWAAGEAAAQAVERQASARLADLDGQDHAGAFMSWQQARQLASEGAEIGSHTVSHALLDECSPEELTDELTRSRRDVQAGVGCECVSLAYPVGRYNTQVAAAAAQAGYELGVTTNDQPCQPGPSPLELPRVGMPARPLSDAELIARVTGLSNAISAFKAKLPPGRSRVVVAAPGERATGGRHAMQVLQSPAQLHAIADEWADLLADSEANSIFLTPQWALAWLQAVHPRARPMVVTARDADGRLVGLLPLYRDTLSLLGVKTLACLRVLGDSQSGAEYGDVIIRRDADAGMGGEMLQTLLDQQDWQCIWLPNLAAWTGGAQRWREALTKAGMLVHSRPRGFAAMPLETDHASYLKRLSGNMRSSLKRQCNRLMGDGEIVFCQTPPQLDEMLNVLFDLNHRRWQSVGQVGTFVRRPSMRRFYEVFAPVAMRRGWLLLAGLHSGGRYIAVQFGYVYGGVFHQLQEGFDPEVEGAGNVLRNAVMECCYQQGLAGYDFLGEFSEHKRRWGAQQREGCDIFAARPTPMMRALFWKEVWPTGKYLRQGWPASEGRH